MSGYASETTTRKPANKKLALEPSEIFELFFKNLELIREWYRLKPDAGREIGHYIQSEISLSHVSDALQCALQGKDWKPSS